MRIKLNQHLFSRALCVAAHSPLSWLARNQATFVGRQNGAVAQLGERMNGIHEVRGSIPLGSTK